MEDKSMSPNPLTDTLKSIRFLRDMPQEYLDQIASISRILDFDDRDVVFREGDTARVLYLIVSGSVSLKIGDGPDCKQIVTLNAGELLGWSSLSDHPHFVATAVAVGPTRIIEIDSAKLRAFCQTDAKFGYELLRRTLLALSKRLVATWTQLAEVYLPQFAPVAVGAAARNE
jgi:CRP-like cAMP-binding protein